jgi:F-type H+-transporting ATPase subunit b
VTRRIAIAAFAACVASWLAPAAALAAGDSGPLWPALNLLLLLSVIVYFARKPVQDFFAGRRTEIEGKLEGAAAELSEAEATYAKWQRRLLELETELEEIRAKSRQRAESERERILADAHTAAERIRRDATAAVDQELRSARAALREEATQLAIEIAAERLQREVTDADRDRLLDEFIERVESEPSRAVARAPEGR